MNLIGIDPDVNKSGYAVWVPSKQQFTMITSMPFFSIIESFNTFSYTGAEFKVYISAGWLIKKASWHMAPNKASAFRVGEKIGRNHQVGMLIEEYCKINKIDHELVRPSGKIKAPEFKQITGWVGRTNADKRDAAMVVFRRRK